ncbi:MAG: aminotransferase class IV [Myxococcota bacterium]
MHVPEIILPVVWLDGAWLPAAEARVSAFDRGFLVADGVFETLLITRGAPVAWAAHRDRLARTASFMSLEPPWDDAGLERIVRGLVRRNYLDAVDAPEAALRLTLTRGPHLGGPSTAFLFGRRLTPGHLARRTDGVRLFRLPFEGRAAGGLARHKTLSHLASSLGQIWLAARTDDPRAEGLFVDASGEVVEGSASNVFIVEDGRLITPPLGVGALPGTARARVVEMAPDLGLEASEEPVSLGRLRAADEVFVTASTLHVAPAVALDDALLGGGVVGPITRRVADAYRARADEDVAAWHCG